MDDDTEVFELDLVAEFAFAAKKFIYAEGGPVICYDCDEVLAYLADNGFDYDEAMEYMDSQMEGARFVWTHDIDFDVQAIKKPSLKLVPNKKDFH
jgi:glutaredoxin-related protein